MAPSGAFRRFAPWRVRRTLLHPGHPVLNWCLVFRKGHPILGAMIDRIVAHYPFYRERRFESVWRAVIHFAGPLCLTETVWDLVATSGLRPWQVTFDFAGSGIFKLDGAESRLTQSTWYASAQNAMIVD